MNILFYPFHSAHADILLSTDQIRRIDETVSVFENSSTTIQYGTIENLHDGRGYTAGRAGFTSRTGDLLDVVKTYLQRTTDSEFAELLPILEKRAKDNDESVEGLRSLPHLWKSRSHRADFRAAQDLINNNENFDPAKRFAIQAGVHTALGMLCFYDATVQHGTGDGDPDGIEAIIAKLRSDFVNEKELLSAFLEIRKKVLLHPYDPTTTDEWSESVGRVIALQKLVDDDNFDLKPFTTNPFGDAFFIQ